MLKFNNVELLITDACNMNCKYCYGIQQPTFMSLQTAIDAIEWGMLRKKKEFLVIDLFGGEPMLNFEVIVALYKHYLGRKDITFHLFTNGTIWDDRLIPMIQDKSYFAIQLSIDGNKTTQNYQRPMNSGEDSFQKVLDTCKKLQNSVSYDIHVKPVVCPNGIERLVEDVKFFVDEGFKIIGQSILRENVGDELWTPERLKTFEKQLQNLSFYYEEVLRKGNPVVLSLLIDPVAGIIRKTDVACWAGKSGMSIVHNGDIYPCARFRKPHDILGNIYKPFEYDEKTCYLAHRNLKNLACSECSIKDCCAGSCPEIQRSLMGSCCLPFPPVCELYKIMSRVSSELFARMKNHFLYREILTSALGGKWRG